MIGADIVVPKMWSFCGSKNSARSAARKLVTLLLLALRKLPRKRSQKRSRKSYSLANPVPCRPYIAEFAALDKDGSTKQPNK